MCSFLCELCHMLSCCCIGHLYTTRRVLTDILGVARKCELRSDNDRLGVIKPYLWLESALPLKVLESWARLFKTNDVVS